MPRVAEDGDDEQVIAALAIEHPVGKSLQVGSAEVLAEDRKGERVRANSVEGRAKIVTKLKIESVALAAIPVRSLPDVFFGQRAEAEASYVR